MTLQRWGAIVIEKVVLEWSHAKDNNWILSLIMRTVGSSLPHSSPLFQIHISSFSVAVTRPSDSLNLAAETWISDMFAFSLPSVVEMLIPSTSWMMRLTLPGPEWLTFPCVMHNISWLLTQKIWQSVTLKVRFLPYTKGQYKVLDLKWPNRIYSLCLRSGTTSGNIRKIKKCLKMPWSVLDVFKAAKLISRMQFYLNGFNPS